MTYRACIFDLDGTLVNTLPTVHYYANVTLAHFGLRSISLGQCQSLCKLSIADFYPGLLRLGGCSEERVEELRETVRTYDLAAYQKDTLYLTEAYAGIRELLCLLRKEGVLTGVLTNKPKPLADEVMETLFPGLLDIVVGQTPDTISKPDPRALTNLLDELKLRPQECLYVGDTDVDMMTAAAAGVDKCAVGWGYQTLEELRVFRPEYVVTDPEELAEILI